MANLIIGEQAIPFTLPGVDGRLHSLVDYGDRMAIAVIFLSNSCSYVRAWEDRLIALQAEYAENGVQFIGINSNDPEQATGETLERMQARAAEKGYNFPYLQDARQEVAAAYGATRTPEVFLFDHLGTLRYHGAIDDNYADPSAVQEHYLRDAINAILAGDRVSLEETDPVGCTIVGVQV
ncbi:MAG TPA: thioredoxin family protein [Aggregatilineales bacterium]|jgi:peroxiredoxin|nr:thioredoxin family protein [Chloroflexota bacterium]HOA23345.1 thioredoxin family protein [Aggregatilineales bacterium]HPV06475.1 thioredoxin family protein [Aggregatilineales bacterium]HQA68140.1 thioredoxin family protein [Aggregatilineales bacterium]HQE17740.1 thioredoxin family protein [Aggregatilineales bacterium]